MDHHYGMKPLQDPRKGMNSFRVRGHKEVLGRPAGIGRAYWPREGVEAPRTSQPTSWVLIRGSQEPDRD